MSDRALLRETAVRALGASDWTIRPQLSKAVNPRGQSQSCSRQPIGRLSKMPKEEMRGLTVGCFRLIIRRSGLELTAGYCQRW